jgi:regulator of protease activity HflC (stomatin/prohibitin superfamily)
MTGGNDMNDERVKNIFLILGMVGVCVLISSCVFGIVAFVPGAVLVILTLGYGLLIFLDTKSRRLMVVGGVGIMALLALTSMSMVMVNAGEVGVVVNSPDGGIRGSVLTNGWHFDPRYALSDIDYIRVNTQVSEYIGKDLADDLDGSVMVKSSDAMDIFMDMSITYNITESKAGYLRFTYGEDWKIVIIHQIARSIPRSVCAGYDALNIVGADRGEIEEKIFDQVKEAIEKKDGVLTGINVVDVKVRELRLPIGLQNAVEQKIIADQMLEKAKIDATRILVEAEALAKKLEAEAKGQALAEIEIAKGKAAAINEVLKSLSVDPDNIVSDDIMAYIAYMYIQALRDPDSNVKFVIVPNDGSGVFVTISP